MAGNVPLRVLVSGSSGFIGKALCRFLVTKGCLVTRLVRKEKKNVPCVLWNPETREGKLEDFEGFDAIIHLAGENLATGMWTSSKKTRILESRKKGTEFFVSLLKQLKSPPKVFLSASAIGYYGSSSFPVTEESNAGAGFLSKVCCLWEEASKSLESFAIRTVHARLGIVISVHGGMLKKILPIFQLGLGGKIGDGKQMISWISLEDVMDSFYHILTKDIVKGPVNIVSPFPVSQETFAKTLAKVLSKPCFFSIPRFLFLGEKAKELILSSIEVRPLRLEETGYAFLFPKLEDAFQSTIKEEKEKVS